MGVKVKVERKKGTDIMVLRLPLLTIIREKSARESFNLALTHPLTHPRRVLFGVSPHPWTSGLL